jgi:hypothetical protein
MASATQADLSRYRTRRDYTMCSNFSFKALMTGGLAALAHQHPAHEAGGRGQLIALPQKSAFGASRPFPCIPVQVG